MTIAVNGGCCAVLLFEKFYKMRSIGEGTLDADLRNRLRGRDQQQARLHQSLAYEPAVRRHKEVAFELLLERRKRAIALLGQPLDGDVVEDVRIDNLLEIVARGIDIAQHNATAA